MIKVIAQLSYSSSNAPLLNGIHSTRPKLRNQQTGIPAEGQDQFQLKVFVSVESGVEFLLGNRKGPVALLSVMPPDAIGRVSGSDR